VISSAGQPLDKVVLRLERLVTADELSKLGGPVPSFRAETDGQGNFVFEGLNPGRYHLRAERPAYIGQSYSASVGVPTLLKLDPGQKVTGINFTLIPQTTIAGRITDENGEPVSHARVAMLRMTFQEGRKHIEPAGAANTAADGSFTIGALPAGRFFLFAEPPAGESRAAARHCRRRVCRYVLSGRH
jgi:hypothetical protein